MRVELLFALLDKEKLLDEEEKGTGTPLLLTSEGMPT
jgi:hypothetical protein